MSKLKFLRNENAQLVTALYASVRAASRAIDSTSSLPVSGLKRSPVAHVILPDLAVRNLRYWGLVYLLL